MTRRRFRYVHLTPDGPQFALTGKGWGDDVRGLTEDEEHFGIELVPEPDYDALTEALAELVRLKDLKDAQDDLAWTKAEKEAAWARARELLAD